MDDSLFGQDNMSTIKLATNGKLSSGKRTRHIKIWFLFIKDRIKSGDIYIVYCPTDRMLADFLTKPLQGNKFKIFRDQLMGYFKSFNLLGGDESSSTLKECVGHEPNNTKFVDQASYNRYSVLGEIDWLENES